MRHAGLALALFASLAFAGILHAQSMPFTYAATVGTSSAQVLAANTGRKRVEFYNPNDTAKVAICPTISRGTSAAITCTVNGAGSITLLPYTGIRIDGIGGNPSLPSAWNAIASASSSKLTIFEYE